METPSAAGPSNNLPGEKPRGRPAGITTKHGQNKKHQGLARRPASTRSKSPPSFADVLTPKKPRCSGTASHKVVRPRPTRPPLAYLPAPNLPPTNHVVPCTGVLAGSTGAVLQFAARAMLSTANQLFEWSRQPDGGQCNFSSSLLFYSREILLPFYGMLVRRVRGGFSFISD